MITPQIFSFLRDIARNNNKSWFEENKNRYLECRDEMGKFCETVIPGLQIFDETLRDAELKGYIFRIYRDARFAKGKKYKEHFGLLFLRGGKPDFHSFAGYHLHIAPGNTFVVAGAYRPENSWLSNIRESFLDDAEPFRNIIAEKNFAKNFSLEGEQLKTAPRGVDKNHKNIDLLRYKSLYAVHRFTDTEVIAENFPENFVEKCKMLYPFNAYLNRCVG